MLMSHYVMSMSHHAMWISHHVMSMSHHACWSPISCDVNLTSLISCNVGLTTVMWLSNKCVLGFCYNCPSKIVYRVLTKISVEKMRDFIFIMIFAKIIGSQDWNYDYGQTCFFLEGRLFELMVKVAPSLYRKYITFNKKRKQRSSMSRCKRPCMAYSRVPAFRRTTKFGIQIKSLWPMCGK